MALAWIRDAPPSATRNMDANDRRAAMGAVGSCGAKGNGSTPRRSMIRAGTKKMSAVESRVVGTRP